jgi:hypothetical protein
MTNVMVWGDLELVPDLKGNAVANGHIADDEIRGDSCGAPLRTVQVTN